MRKYTLASADARATVDLRDYENVIADAVHEVLPLAEVVVERDCYYVSPTPKQGDAVRIGRLICRSALNKHCVKIPKLFSSIEVKGDDKDGNEEKRVGGHY